MSKKNIKQIVNSNLFYKTYRETLFEVLDHPDLPLWIKVLNQIILEVEFEQGYVSCSFIKKLSDIYGTEDTTIYRAIRKLIDNNWVLKYPFGAKRAKGYMLNPAKFWVGDEESKHQKVAIYRNSLNKLQINVDVTGEDNVYVTLINKDKEVSVTTNYQDLAA